MNENNKEWFLYKIDSGRAEDCFQFPISDLPWSDLSVTLYRKSMTRAKKSLAEAGFNTVGELIQYLEDRRAQNLSPAIPGFGLGSYIATRDLFESVGFELPEAKYNN